MAEVIVKKLTATKYNSGGDWQCPISIIILLAVKIYRD
jgi:pyruvate/2-oxoglutarate/acetoin dehydrogenase E1 component